MAITTNQEILFKAMMAASFEPGSAAKPAVSVEINGHTFTVKYNISTRKCYDNLPTPTVQFKVDGKVTPRVKAFALAI